MEIYSINIDGKKFKRYKTCDDALLDFELQMKINPNSNIIMIMEDFCDYGDLDTCCKIHILCEYNDNKLKKYI